MKEAVLRDFFLGKVSAAELAADVKGSRKMVSAIQSQTAIVDMDSEFEVTPEMLIKLCDAVLAGELPAPDLEIIGFALQASDTFTWDGDVVPEVADVTADWSCPSINYPLTLENVQRFRRWLTKEEPYPEKPAIAEQRRQAERLQREIERRRHK